MNTIIKNISTLVTAESHEKKYGEAMKDAGIINNAYIVIKDGLIYEVGEGKAYENYIEKDSIILDGEGKTVTPGLIDSHTHVIYAGSREKELKMKLNKVSYIDILKSGGGILSTVKSVREASLEKLCSVTRKRLDLMLAHGTTTVESKSGYALNFEDEIKMLTVNKQLNNSHPIDLVSTYLGAHAVPVEYKENTNGYIDLMINKVIPYIEEKNLAEYIDCFCEPGVYNTEEAKKILLAGRAHGLKIKIHSDEMESIGAAYLAGELKAESAEHLVAATDEGIEKLSESKTVAVLLPATSFYLMLGRFARARYMIDKGVPIALATDCNPGTCPTESLQTVMTFASFGMRLLPEEIINAMTINAAYAVGREDTIGSIEKGKKADITIFNGNNLDYLIYHFGVNSVSMVLKDGKIVVKEGVIVNAN